MAPAVPPRPPRRFRPRTGFVASILLALLAAGCAPAERDRPREVRFEPARFSDLPGWTSDDHDAALAAFVKTCPLLLKRGAGRLAGAADWRSVCAEASRLPDGRSFFERNFVPVRVTDGRGSADGLVTGYYEPELRGSRRRDARHAVPLYRRPPELVGVDLGEFREDLKGRRVAGAIVGGRLRPYHDRAGIARGALRGRGLELIWVDSAIDAFFLQIQGSGRVRLNDGTVMRLGYDGLNGQPYTAIGRSLVRDGEISAEDMSMQAIRKWLAARPEKGRLLMETNRSYVFFREISGGGPIGSAGVALTPGRSVAVDRRHVPLGLPVWLDTTYPEGRPLRRLTVAQDTGGAISGAVRADVFWGAGARAAETAGRMKSSGRYWILRPKTSTPAS